jgi:hypothetical protein
MFIPTQQNAGRNHDGIKITNKSIDNVGNSKYFGTTAPN